MKVDKEKVFEHIEFIEICLKEYNDGFDNKEAKSKIVNHLNALSYSLNNFSYFNEKIASIDGNIKVLYSVRKHEKYGGTQKVKHMIYRDLENIKRYISRL